MLLLMKKKVLAFYFPFWLFWWKGLIEKSCWHWIFFLKSAGQSVFYYYYFFPLTTAHLVRWSHFCCFFCFWRRLNWGLIKREKEDEKKSWLSLMISPFFYKLLNCSLITQWPYGNRLFIIVLYFSLEKTGGQQTTAKSMFPNWPISLVCLLFHFHVCLPSNVSI